MALVQETGGRWIAALNGREQVERSSGRGGLLEVLITCHIEAGGEHPGTIMRRERR